MSITRDFERLEESIQAVFTGKETLADALTAKGVATFADSSFETLAENLSALEAGAMVHRGVFVGNGRVTTRDLPMELSCPFEPRLAFIRLRNMNGTLSTAHTAAALLLRDQAAVCIGRTAGSSQLVIPAVSLGALGNLNLGMLDYEASWSSQPVACSVSGYPLANMQIYDYMMVG